MGCSPSRSEAPLADAPNVERFEETYGREVLCGRQSGGLASTSPTKWGTRTSSPPSHSYVRALADDAHDLDTMAIDWPQLLCGTQANVQATSPTTSSLTHCHLEAGTSSEDKINMADKYSYPQPTAFDESAQNGRAGSKRSVNSVKSFFSAFSLSSRPLEENDGDLPLLRFDLASLDELRDIQAAILQGMLRALAHSSDITLALGALPCNPKIALMHCQRAIRGQEATLADLVLALTDLVISFKGPLVEAGLSRKFANELHRILGQLELSHVHSSSAGDVFVHHIEVSELVTDATSTFLGQDWERFGYAAGHLANTLALNDKCSSIDFGSKRHFHVIFRS